MWLVFLIHPNNINLNHIGRRKCNTRSRSYSIQDKNRDLPRRYSNNEKDQYYHNASLLIQTDYEITK